MTLMSQRQYAAHRRVARYSIAEGRISTTPDGRIDSDLADAEWERNTIAPEGDGSRLLKARTVYMVSKARLADMQLKKLTGELLPAAEVKVAAFNAARRIRDACMNIPTRCCGAVAAEIRRAMQQTGVGEEMAANGKPRAVWRRPPCGPILSLTENLSQDWLPRPMLLMGPQSIVKCDPASEKVVNLGVLVFQIHKGIGENGWQRLGDGQRNRMIVHREPYRVLLLRCRRLAHESSSARCPTDADTMRFSIRLVAHVVDEGLIPRNQLH